MLSVSVRLFTSLLAREIKSALMAAGAVVVRGYPGRGVGRGGERVASMEPLDPSGLCLREGDLVIFERKPVEPPPPEVVELVETSRNVDSVMLLWLSPVPP